MDQSYSRLVKRISETGSMSYMNEAQRHVKAERPNEMTFGRGLATIDLLISGVGLLPSG
jgi:hypothetical protein